MRADCLRGAADESLERHIGRMMLQGEVDDAIAVLEARTDQLTDLQREATPARSSPASRSGPLRRTCACQCNVM